MAARFIKDRVIPDASPAYTATGQLPAVALEHIRPRTFTGRSSHSSAAPL